MINYQAGVVNCAKKL